MIVVEIVADGELLSTAQKYKFLIFMQIFLQIFLSTDILSLYRLVIRMKKLKVLTICQF